MDKNNKNQDTTFLDQYDDQYYEIKDSLEIEDSTDSETTDILNFRVTNSNNQYPSKQNSIVDDTCENKK